MTAPRPTTTPPPVSPNGHRPAGGGSAGVPRGPSTALPTTNWPKGYVALAVMLMVGLAVLGYWFYTRAGAKTPVLEATRTIAAGQVIGSSDLTTVNVAGPVTAVAGDHRGEVVGKTAAVPILAHTPVQLAMLSTKSALGPGQALVGLAEAPGQIPSSGLAPGDEVQVLALPAKTATAAPPGSPLLATARVWDVRANPAAAGGVLITLIVPRAAAYSITAAGDAGLVALVQVDAGP